MTENTKWVTLVQIRHYAYISSRQPNVTTCNNRKSRPRNFKIVLISPMLSFIEVSNVYKSRHIVLQETECLIGTLQ